MGFYFANTPVGVPVYAQLDAFGIKASVINVLLSAVISVMMEPVLALATR